MQDELIFKVYSLLEKKNGHISGPMSQIEFAVEMSGNAGPNFNRIARIEFEDHRVLQCCEDGGYTGHDMLILAEEYLNDLLITLWVDTGTGGVPVAMAFQSDREIDISDGYREYPFSRKLTPAEIQKIFNHVFENPEILAIKDEDAKS